MVRTKQTAQRSTRGKTPAKFNIHPCDHHCHHSKAADDVDSDAESEGLTPLFLAAKSGNLQQAVDLLHEKDTDVNSVTFRGRSPIMVAAKHGHVEMVDLLLKHGADVNEGLFLAAKEAKVGVVDLLCKRGADVNSGVLKLVSQTHGMRYQFMWLCSQDKASPMNTAAQKKCMEIVALLCKHGADVNPPCDDMEDAPLVIAVRGGHVDVVETLCKHGADINKGDCSYKTPLYWAAQEDYKDVAELLCKLGADVNHESLDSDFDPPLFAAVEKGNMEMAALLCEHGADINREDSQGNTPLFVSARYGHESEVAEVLKRGADVNHQNHDGQTSLFIAAGRTYVGAAKILCQHGAVVDHVDNNGNTPLWIAAERMNDNLDEMVSILCKHGANVNHSNVNGYTPIMAVASTYYRHYSSPKSVKLLLAQPQICDQRNNDNQTVLDLVIEGITGNHDGEDKQLVEIMETIELLVKAGFSSAAVASNVETPLTSLLKIGNSFTNRSEDVQERFCRCLMLLLSAYSCVESDQQLMKVLHPMLASRGMEHASDMCAIPTSLKRLCKCTVRTLMRKPLAVHVVQTELPQHLQHYVLLEITD